MSRVRGATCLTLLGAVLALTAAPAATTSAAPSATVVVSLGSGGEHALRSSGVDVLARYRHVRVAVVSGTARELRALAAAPGIRSVSADVALRPAGHEQPRGGGVFSWQHLGGRAGRAGSGAGVTVAVVDTGVSDTAALSRAGGRLVDGVDTSGENVTTDGYGHGTFLAGVVAGGPVTGTGGRGLGVAPAAQVVSVKVADATGTTSLVKVVAGLDWVAAHADSVDVATLAFSRSRPGTGYGPDPLTDAVERVRDAGVTIVVSAGNVATEVSDPGFTPRALTVGAADLRRAPVIAPFSGHDVVAGVPKPDVVASGVGVLSVLPAGSTLAQQHASAQRPDGLWRGTGTSQAAATTAGAVALFLQNFPDATTREVKASIRAAARPIRGDGGGAGLLGLAHRVVSGEPDADGGDSGGDGEGGFDANSWGANSWGANSWGANSWGANSWGADSWGASSWGSYGWGDAEGER